MSPLPGVRGPGVLLKSRVSRSPPAPQGGEEGEGHPGTIARRCSPWALFSGSFQVPWAVCVCTGKKNSVGSRSWWGKADVSLFSFDPRLVVETLGAVGTS